MTMLAPCPASASTTALPMPVFPPVTMATFPCSVMSLLSGGDQASPRYGMPAIRLPPSEPVAEPILRAPATPRSRAVCGVDSPGRAGGIIVRVAVLSLEDATASLVARDRVMASLVERHGPPPRRRPVRAARRFGDLAQTIVYQQLAGNAAAS